ncbi:MULTISPECIES: YetF domain-containing protein [Bacillus]|uniref:YetF domain-containing protein n=1 Tax=Bacillus TaxID=1386 RepID=UPI00035D28BE|nr:MULTISPECIES: DUF421 domain-containing protein [Bacillus]
MIFISVRTVFLYFIILLIFRLMGKREIAELSVLDLIVFMMIAELAVVAIDDLKLPLFEAILPMIILLIIQIVLSLISLKSQKFRNLIDGTPTIIINNGKIDERAMRKQRYNFDDLLEQLREKDVFNVADIQYAILEPSGELSVMKKPSSSNKNNTPLPLPLILDGKVQEENLSFLNVTNEWLMQQLQKQGYNQVQNISYCSFGDKGELYIDELES